MNSGKVCVSVVAKTAGEMLGTAERAAEVADVVELRFDALDPDQIGPALGRIGGIRKPVLVTFRPEDQGGERLIPTAERSEFWNKAIGAAEAQDGLFDLEYDIAADFDLPPEQVIISHHNFGSSTPATADQLTGLGGDGRTFKIVTMAKDITDTIAVWKLFEDDRLPKVIPIAMGEAGEWTRVLGLAHGAPMTYASLERSGATAPGQLTADELINLYRVHNLTPNTKVYGVIGDPVSQSLSPYFQNAAFQHVGLDAVFLRLLVKDLDRFIERLVVANTREVELNFAGFSVTMPHKQAIISYLDSIESAADKIGAVNTVRVSNGKLEGFNTDALGFIAPLRRKLGDLKGSRAAVLGAGGAARACIYSLQQDGTAVDVFARDPEKGRGLAAEFGVNYGPLPFRSNGESYDILVNATPLGMGDVQRSPVDASELDDVKLVYDLVTSRAPTPLISAARAANIPTIEGSEMLLAQGAAQFELWTGEKAPVELMQEALTCALSGEAYRLRVK